MCYDEVFVFDFVGFVGVLGVVYGVGLGIVGGNWLWFFGLGDL